MQPVHARQPWFDLDFENELSNDMRLPALYAQNALLEPKHQIKDELILVFTSPTQAMQQLVRDFNLHLVFDAGCWTRSMEKKYELFFTNLLRDGHPETAQIYRVRQLVVALQRFSLSANESLKLVHWCLKVAGPRPFPGPEFRCCVPHGVQ